MGGQEWEPQTRLIRRRKPAASTNRMDVSVTVKPEPVSVVAELHKAKEELAQELEANLKQLKQVLQETERIAKDMEAVLKQAKEPAANAGPGGAAAKAEAKNQPAAQDGAKKGAPKKAASTPDPEEQPDEAEAEEPDPDDPTFYWGRDQEDNDEDWDPLEDLR